MDGSDKKFYWLKLNKDFFKQHEITVIEGMHNGKDYILFYLKLLCESLSHDGNLRFSDEIPYDEEMLANLTHTNIDIVRVAVQLFTKLHMMEILDDGTLFMNRVREITGSETKWAKYKRIERTEQGQIGQELDNVQTMSSKSKEIRDKCIKKEEVPKGTYKKENATAAYKGVSSHEATPLFKEMFNSIDGVIRCEKITVKREIAVSTILSHFTQDEINKVFEKLANSPFLKGDNKRGWKVTFDWLFDIDNFTNVLEGKYDNQKVEKPEERNLLNEYTPEQIAASKKEDEEDLMIWRRDHGFVD